MQCFKVMVSKIGKRVDPSYLVSAFGFDKKENSNIFYVELGDLLSESPTYGANEQAVEGDKNKDFLYIRITDIDEHGLLRSDVWKTAGKIANKYILKANDLLFARSGATVGKCYMYQMHDGQAIYAGYLIRFRVDITKVIPAYIFYWTQLSQYKIWISFNQRAAGQPNINSNEFKSLKIPLLSLLIQKQVVNILDAAYASKKAKEAEAERLLASIDNYVLSELGIKLPKTQSKTCFALTASGVEGKRIDPLYYSQNILIGILAVPNKKINEVVEYVKTGFAAGKQDQETKNPTDAFIQIRPTNLDEMGRLKFDKNIYISKSRREKRLADLLEKNEVLFNNTNSQELVGKSAYFNLDGDYFCSNHITRIKTNSLLLKPAYLAAVLNVYQHGKVFYSICTNWNNQSGVNASLLGNLPIPLPSLNIQERIATEVQSLMEHSQKLKCEATEYLEKAKKHVEAIILGK